MDIELSQVTILEGLKIASLVQGKQDRFVTLAANENRATFAGFNRGSGSYIEAGFDCVASAPGIVALPADKIAQIASAGNKRGAIQLQLKNGGLFVGLGRNKARLLVNDEGLKLGDRLSSAGSGDGDLRISFDSPAPIKALLQRVAGPLDSDSPNDISTVVQLVVEPDRVTARSTDGERFIEASCPATTNVSEPVRAHIPSAAHKVIYKLLTDKILLNEYDCALLTINPNYVGFTMGPVKYLTSATTIALPNLSRILDHTAPYYECFVDAHELNVALTVLLATADAVMQRFYVDAKFLKDEIRLQTIGRDAGRTVSTLEAEYTGEERFTADDSILTRFSMHSLIEATKGVDRVRFKFKRHKNDNPATPEHVIIMHEDDPFSTKHVIMPQVIR